MTDNQENRFSMYNVTNGVLTNNSGIWSSVPAFVTTKATFDSQITAIHTASQQQQAIITGIATDKKVLKVSLINLASPVAAAVIAYASQTNNNELLDAVNYTQTQLTATRDDMLADRCQIIHDRANANIADLADYGIDAAVLTTLQTAITAYNTKVSEPGVAKQTKKTATINLRNLFKETDKKLKMELDKLMLTFKASNPDFYNDYKGAREIIDLGATHTRLRVTVKDESNSLIGSALVALLEEGVTVYSLQTKSDGTVNLTKIKPGIYDLKVVKAGYVTKVEANVEFKAGKIVQRTVTLETGSPPPPGGGDEETGTITGTVSSPDLAGGFTVKVEGTDISVGVAADGSFTLENVPAGEQTVTCTSDSDPAITDSKTVEVIGGDTATVDFEL